MNVETSYTSQWLRAMLENHSYQKMIIDVGSNGSVYGSHLPHHIGIDRRNPAPVLEQQVFQKMNAADMEFDDGTFKTVICHNLINYAGYAAYGHKPFDYGPERVVLECLRVLAPGGLFILEAPVGVSATVEGPMGVVKNFSLGEFRSLLIGGEVLEEQYYIKEPDRYKRCGSELVTTATHKGYCAGAAVCVVIRRDVSPLPELGDFAQRIPAVPDTNEPVSPDVEEFKAKASTHEQQLAKARNIGAG